MKIEFRTFAQAVYISILPETANEYAELLNLTMNHKIGEPSEFYTKISSDTKNNPALELAFNLVDSKIRKQYIEKSKK